jgi:hypothetical protein
VSGGLGCLDGWRLAGLELEREGKGKGECMVATGETVVGRGPGALVYLSMLISSLVSSLIETSVWSLS